MSPVRIQKTNKRIMIAEVQTRASDVQKIVMESGF